MNGPRKLLAHAANAPAVSSAAATKILARLEVGGGRTILPLASTMSDLHHDFTNRTTNTAINFSFVTVALWQASFPLCS